MSYTISIQRTAQKELSQLPADMYERIRDEIRLLAENPRPIGCLKLKGRDGWRIRVGDYRVIYEIDDKEQSILIRNVGDRKDIYR
ncbi:MAG: type II toxin-antitoxin system RelE/ParE family toxin [Ignavibacteriales bacterium]|nr:type II toxin-antitoxin system RelE/ParE family toxin [Ignavibacteriales bacterium]